MSDEEVTWDGPGAGAVEINNEFAAVTVAIDRTGNDARLRIEDKRSGEAVFLDALQLETLVWVTGEQMNALLDPRRRWGDDDGDNPSSR